MDMYVGICNSPPININKFKKEYIVQLRTKYDIRFCENGQRYKTCLIF